MPEPMNSKIYHLNPEERIRLIARIAGILESCGGVAFAYLFGSFLEGGPFRDVDVGLYLSDTPKDNFLETGAALSQHLSRELGVPADVRNLNVAPVSFLYHVIRGRLIFEKDEELRTRVVEQTIQRYLDLKPLIRRGVKEAFGDEFEPRFNPCSVPGN